MKEGRCLKWKDKGYTILNYPKNAKVSSIIDALDIDDIENINHEQE